MIPPLCLHCEAKKKCLFRIATVLSIYSFLSLLLFAKTIKTNVWWWDKIRRWGCDNQQCELCEGELGPGTGWMLLSIMSGWLPDHLISRVTHTCSLKFFLPAWLCVCERVSIVVQVSVCVNWGLCLCLCVSTWHYRDTCITCCMCVCGVQIYASQTTERPLTRITQWVICCRTKRGSCRYELPGSNNPPPRKLPLNNTVWKWSICSLNWLCPKRDKVKTGH